MQRIAQKRENGNSPLETSLLLLLGPICSSFSLLEALLVAGNEVVVAELGGVEEMVIRGLEVFKENEKDGGRYGS